jgi:autotransporter-associated beta strand protein
MPASIYSLPRLSVLALAVSAACQLSACASGGATHQEPVPMTLPEPAPPPPPPTRQLTLPAAPVPKLAPAMPAIASEGDQLRIPLVDEREVITDVRTVGSLTKQGAGELVVVGTSRFDGGTRIQSGLLTLWEGGVLFSDVSIAPGATFDMAGDVVGDVFNDGVFDPTDDVIGWYNAFFDGEIFGDYTQGPEGLLRLYFGVEDNWLATPLLQVSGVARLDGQLQFLQSAYIPSGGYLEWVLHANGGVVGQFDGWTAGTGAKPLFLTGSLRYDADDVWFEATRVSTQAALAASGVGSPVTLASAANVDAAFDGADRIVGSDPASLSAAQRSFLRSAASLQRIDDPTRASRTFDSLSGRSYLDAARAIAGQGFSAASELAEHAAAVRMRASGAYGNLDRTRASAAGELQVVQSAGVDRWLSNDWLAGLRVGLVQGNLALAGDGGLAGTRAPTAQAYLRRLTASGAYALGSVGLGLHHVELARDIDVGQWARRAGSQQDAALLHVAFETGHDHALGGGTLSTFVALDYSALRGAGFTESGGTGFELHADASLLQDAAAGVGLRYARRWQRTGDSWWQLGIDARYQPRIWTAGTVHAAFTGMPDVGFGLFDPGAAYAPVAGALRLAGGRQRLSWQLQASRFGGQDAVSADVTFSFR